MDKIKINLLPPEIKNKAKKEAKQAAINKISIGLLGVWILITSGILALVIFQRASVNSLSNEIEREKARIQSKRDVEAVVYLLKNRVDTINQFSTKRYKQRDVFDLVTSLSPQGVVNESMQIGKTPKVLVSGHTQDTLSLQRYFNNLTDVNATEGKITSVTIENLHKSQQGRINIELSIHLAQGTL